MTKADILKAIVTEIAEARFQAYVLFEKDEYLSIVIDSRLRDMIGFLERAVRDHSPEQDQDDTPADLRRLLDICNSTAVAALRAVAAKELETPGSR